MITGLILLALGLGEIVWMIWAIRTNAAEDRISLIEAAVLRVGNAEPLPKSKLGIGFDKLQLWLGLLLGVILTALGLLFIVVE